MISYEDHQDNIRVTGITVSEFRRHLAHYIAMVRYGDDWVRIQRKGMEPVYLVSEADMQLIWKTSDEFYAGPKDPVTGKLPGRGFMHWVRQGFRQDRGKV